MQTGIIWCVYRKGKCRNLYIFLVSYLNLYILSLSLYCGVAFHSGVVVYSASWVLPVDLVIWCVLLLFYPSNIIVCYNFLIVVCGVASKSCPVV